MADSMNNKSEEEEKKIPIFTVLKKGNIIKNIFLLDNPLPLISEPESIEYEENCKTTNNHKNEEAVLVVGRHPDCNIMLEHPSISRFHLRIHLQPSSHKLSVIDLSSAHGTWVSDRKIEPQVRVELSEGDTLRLGASTRIYRLHWFARSRAFDFENTLISSILENPLTPEETEDDYHDDDETFQNKNPIPFLREQKEIPSAPPMPENMNNSFTDNDEGEEILPAAPMFEESPLRTHNQRDILSIWAMPVVSESVNSSSSLPVERIPLEMTDKEFNKENQENSQAAFALDALLPSERENVESPPRKSEQKSNAPSLWSRRGKSANLLRVQTGWSQEKKMGVSKDIQIEVENQNEIESEMVSKVLFCGSDGEEEIFTPDKENCTPKTVIGLKSVKGRVEEIKQLKPSGSLSSKVTIGPSPDQEDSKFMYSEKENLTPIVFQDSKSKKPASGRSQVRLETEMIMKKRREGRVPFQSLVANSTSKSKSEISVLKAITSKSSSSVNCSLTMEKHSRPSSNQSDGETNRRRWNMVVDTSCLLNKESRRSLQLLQGLKGTHLIIPRMVIRELDCLKRRGSLFRKASEISSVLQWIEECMVKTKWWIHVQNSLEEVMLIAPTPPASPRSQLSEGSRPSEGSTGMFTSLVPFSTCGNLMEIVSPTAEDHILDCALLFKRIKNDGQLVLLTNDVTLKIKAMAEGLLCETAEAFRESLVNPLSERFLWVESTPRGPTWSCLDEADLRENYKHFPLKKTTKAAEGAKGLKLILLHNSHYKKINLVN